MSTFPASGPTVKSSKFFFNYSVSAKGIGNASKSQLFTFNPSAAETAGIGNDLASSLFDFNFLEAIGDVGLTVDSSLFSLGVSGSRLGLGLTPLSSRFFLNELVTTIGVGLDVESSAFTFLFLRSGGVYLIYKDDSYTIVVDKPVERLYRRADGTVLALRSQGLSKSTDGGNTWTSINDTIQLTAITETTDDPNSGILWGRSGNLIKKSTDGGVTWANYLDLSWMGTLGEVLLFNDPQFPGYPLIVPLNKGMMLVGTPDPAIILYDDTKRRINGATSGSQSNPTGDSDGSIMGVMWHSYYDYEPVGTLSEPGSHLIATVRDLSLEPLISSDVIIEDVEPTVLNGHRLTMATDDDHLTTAYLTDRQIRFNRFTKRLLPLSETAAVNDDPATDALDLSMTSNGQTLLGYARSWDGHAMLKSLGLQYGNDWEIIDHEQVLTTGSVGSIVNSWCNGYDLLFLNRKGTIIGQVTDTTGLHWEIIWDLNHPLNDIWFDELGHYFIVGDNGFMATLDVNATDPKWQTIVTDTNQDLVGIWGATAGEIYVVSKTSTFYYDGSSLVERAIDPAPTELRDVFGFGQAPNTVVYAVGSTGIYRHRPSLTYWEKLNVSGDYETVWGSSTADVYVGGAYKLQHFDGSTWTELPLTSLVSDFIFLDRNATTAAWEQIDAIWGTGSNDVYIGSRISYSPGGPSDVVLHWDGSDWKPLYSEPIGSKSISTFCGFGTNVFLTFTDSKEILALDTTIPYDHGTLNEETKQGILAARDNSFIFTDVPRLYGWGADDFIADFIGDMEIPTKLSSWWDDVVDVSITKDPSLGAHILALKDAGSSLQLWVWGRNTDGQLGLGDKIERTEPVEYDGSTAGIGNVVKAEAGGDFTVLLDDNGDVWTCGSNLIGQLGLGLPMGTDDDVTIPQQVSVSNIIDIAVGTWHTLALRNDGTVFSWGSDIYGALGRDNGENFQPADVNTATDVITLTGHGLTTGTKIKFSSTGILPGGLNGTTYYYVRALTANTIAVYPTRNDAENDINRQNLFTQGTGTHTAILPQLPGIALTGVAAIAAGSHHSLFLMDDGTVRTCGRNTDGELGDGTNVNRRTPVEIGLGTGTVTAVVAGCHFSLALMDDNTLKSWGDNSYGQLGDGTNVDSNVPVTVNGDSSPLENVSAISAGTYHAIALTTGGFVWTWGRNDAGQLGTGDFNDRNLPELIANSDWSPPVDWGQDSYDPVETGADFSRVFVTHLNQVLVCGEINITWVNNWKTQDDQCANTDPRFITTIEGNLTRHWSVGEDRQLWQSGTTISTWQTVPWPRLATLAAGGNSSYALDEDGRLYSWGHNDKGQLGLGDVVDRHQPIFVSDGWEQISSSNDSLLLVKATELWMCGNDQSDPGISGNQSIPTKLDPQPGTVTAIARGDLHSIALLSNGSIVTWGDDSYGQLGGTPDVNGYAHPTISNVKAIAVGYGFSLALKTDGTLYAWGRGGDGSLGIGSLLNKSTPTYVRGGIQQIAAGYGHCLAVTTANQLLSWGRNSDGQLGLGDTAKRTLPELVTDLTPQFIACGKYHSLVGSAVGLWVAGENANGQLGLDDSINNQLTFLKVNSSSFLALAGANYHSLALTADQLLASGSNAYGQLGNGITTDSFEFTDVFELEIPNSLSTFTADKDLFAIYAFAEDDIFAVGKDGLITHYDGSTWTTMITPTDQWLTGIWGNSPTDIFVCGYFGTLLHYDGSSWQLIASGTTEHLRYIDGVHNGDVYCVGDNGTILRLRPTLIQSAEIDVSGGGIGGTDAVDVISLDHHETAYGIMGWEEFGEIKAQRLGTGTTLIGTPILIDNGSTPSVATNGDRWAIAYAVGGIIKMNFRQNSSNVATVVVGNGINPHVVAITNGFAVSWEDGDDIRTAHYDLIGNLQSELLIDSFSGNTAPITLNAGADSITVYQGYGPIALAPPDILASQFSEQLDEIDAAITGTAELIVGNIENGIAVLERKGNVTALIKLTAPNLSARSIDVNFNGVVLVLADDSSTGKPQVYEYINNQLMHRATINVVGSGTSINALSGGWGIIVDRSKVFIARNSITSFVPVISTTGKLLSYNMLSAN